jgi:hypothetical protein
LRNFRDFTLLSAFKDYGKNDVERLSKKTGLLDVPNPLETEGGHFFVIEEVVVEGLFSTVG